MPNEFSGSGPVRAEPVSVSTDMRAGRPWVKICCGGCLVFLLVLGVGFSLLWKTLGGGKGPQVLQQLPANFPPSVSLYQVEYADSIDYFSGKEKNKTFGVLLSPLRMFGSVMVSTSEKETASTTMRDLMDASVSQIEQIDTVTVRWTGFAGTRDEVIRYYVEQFSRNGFSSDARRDEATGTDNIVARRNDINIQLLVQDLPDVEGVDRIVVEVDYLNQTN